MAVMINIDVLLYYIFIIIGVLNQVRYTPFETLSGNQVPKVEEIHTERRRRT